MSKARPLTQADIDHLKEMRDLLVSSGATRWGDEEEAAWSSDETIDRLIQYWAHLLAERGQDVFEVVFDLRPGGVWGRSRPATCEMFYSYLDEVARGDHVNTA